MRSRSESFSPERRALLAGLASFALAPRSVIRALEPQAGRDIWFSAQGSRSDAYGLSWYRSGASQVETALSGFRGHGGTQHPLRPGSVLMFARRPGTSAIEVDLEGGVVERRFECSSNRHLYGHGCFSRDGKILFTTESDIGSGKGKIGIRDARTYRVLGEYESYGIGPHDIRLMPDGQTLVIANGGIATHPDTGRAKLNLDTMQSRLTYIDVSSGKRVDDLAIAEPKSSIRHLDVAADGTVVIGVQMQREAAGHDRTVPLAGIHKPGNAIQMLDEPNRLIDAMEDYVGSVVISEPSRLAGFTSPRGDLAVFWNIDSGELAGYHQLGDVCGISVTSDRRYFVLSSSTGQLRFLNARTLKENRDLRVSRSGTRWDNHLAVASM